jgi:putative ABC transport system permease protein
MDSKRKGPMILAFKLAWKNLMGSGLRTWLNGLVLSFSFVMIIFYNGLMDGWNNQARKDTIEWEIGQGLLHAEGYDDEDPFSIKDGHKPVPNEPVNTPVLIRQATIYPEGRMVSVQLRGIPKSQNSILLPTDSLSGEGIPVLIGKRMAEANKLKTGDEVLIRWRDKNEAFDAAPCQIAGIFDNDVASVDQGIVWMDLEKLWVMTGLEGRASYCILSEELTGNPPENWIYKSTDALLADLNEVVEMKKSSSAILYLLLLAIALLAIFDTQVLSIFRRQKEIGTYVALGMTRWDVVKLFTVEGAMYSLFAIIVGSLYGIPLFAYMANNGMVIPQASQDAGITIAERIFPYYGAQLVIGTIILIIIAATIVSFLPTRKIAKMDPVAALKGKLQ